MKRVFGIILCSILWQGCGLETVNYIPPPNISFPPSGDLKALAENSDILAFQHNAADFQNYSFLGYEFYYKIYPSSNSYDFSVSLPPDVGGLDTLTRDRLISLQYTKLSMQPVQIPLLKEADLPSDCIVALDFRNFLAQVNPLSDSIQPDLSVYPSTADALNSTNSIYQASVIRGISNTSEAYFSSLVKSDLDLQAVDLDSALKVDNTFSKVQIFIFVVSYAFSLEKGGDTYSIPKPLGALGPIPFRGLP